jgi:hypothetical protein
MIWLGLLALVMAATWRRRGGGLLPLAIAFVVLLPVGGVAWLVAEIHKRRLARPARVRRTLATLGLTTLGLGHLHAIAVRRVGKGNMNAVLEVTTANGKLVLKHMLRFGTLLAFCARELGAMREYPRRLGTFARTVREVRASRRLRRNGLRAPRVLAFDLRSRALALEWIDGVDLATRLDAHALRLGRLLARMHALDYSMGDANPRNLLVDGSGQLVAVDLEVSHLRTTAAQRGFDLAWVCAFLRDDVIRARLLDAYGPRSPAQRGFDLAWVCAFLRDDVIRARLLDAYGPRSPELEHAFCAARAHIARFSPLPRWEARRWSEVSP